MKKSYNLEAASLRVLSGFYRNDMALLSRHAYERFLFDVPGHTPGKQTPLSIRDILLFTDHSVRYAVRIASRPVLSQFGPVSTILFDFTLNLYRHELPEAQNQYQFLISWLNTTNNEEDPDWRITLFQISDPAAGTGIAKRSSAHLSAPSIQRDGIIREPRSSYPSLRSHLIRIKDADHTIHFLEKDDIIWAENNHMHSIIHTHAGIIHANRTLSQLAGDALSHLYCPHKSYLINPNYLYQVNKLHLIMTDGAIIPIAERRFAQVKKDLCLTQ